MKNVRLFNWAKGKEKGENENFHFGRRNGQVEFPLQQFPNQGC